MTPEMVSVLGNQVKIRMMRFGPGLRQAARMMTCHLCGAEPAILSPVGPVDGPTFAPDWYYRLPLGESCATEDEYITGRPT